MKQPDRDLIIIGGGAAGLAAAQYGARSGLNTLLIEEAAPGGQSLLIDSLENYPGYDIPITGYDMAVKFQNQAEKFGAEMLYATVSDVSKEGDLFTITAGNESITTLTVILATGAKHRHLGSPGEETLAGRGVSYCATCDGPFFRGKKILVVGGGDAACDEAMFLSKLSDQVVQIHRRDRFRAQKAVGDRVINNENIEVRFNTTCKEIKGDGKVQSIVFEKADDHTSYEEAFDAVFIFVGMLPQTALVDSMTEKDETGYIITDECMKSSTKGLYAVGDVRNTPFRQIITAASDGAVAAHCAAYYIDELKGEAYN